VSEAAANFGRRRHSMLMPVRTFGRGRVCRADGCATVLSLYNPSDFCALHEERVDLVEFVPAKRSLGPPMIVQCAFSECGSTFTTRNPRRKYCSDSCRMKAFQRRERSERGDRAA
jgi:hypothetical protein